MISPLEGEMAAKRPEGVAAREAPTSPSSYWSVAAVEATPSVAFGDISPSRGEICRRYTNTRFIIIASGEGILPRNAV